MKPIRIMALVLALVLVQGCNQQEEGKKADTAEATTETASGSAMTSLESRVSYAIGMSVGEHVTSAEFDLDQESFKAGLNDVLAGNEQRLTDEEIEAAMTEFQEQMQAQAKAEAEAEAEKQLELSKSFLAENREKEGVTETDSGLQYRVITEGEGPIPTADDTVTVHYKGTLVDGTVFDSSYERGEPAEFPVTAVIPGWVEALQLMPVGSKWEVVLPPELAYGTGGTRGIPPNAALVFEVELLDKQAAETETAPKGETDDAAAADTEEEAPDNTAQQ